MPQTPQDGYYIYRGARKGGEGGEGRGGSELDTPFFANEMDGRYLVQAILPSGDTVQSAPGDNRGSIRTAVADNGGRCDAPEEYWRRMLRRVYLRDGHWLIFHVENVRGKKVFKELLVHEAAAAALSQHLNKHPAAAHLAPTNRRIRNGGGGRAARGQAEGAGATTGRGRSRGRVRAAAAAAPAASQRISDSGSDSLPTFNSLGESRSLAIAATGEQPEVQAASVAALPGFAGHAGVDKQALRAANEALAAELAGQPAVQGLRDEYSSVKAERKQEEACVAQLRQELKRAQQREQALRAAMQP